MANNARKRREGLADMAIEPRPEPDFHEQFPPEDLIEERIDYALGPEDRCIQRWLSFHHRVVWFAMMQQTLVDGVWLNVARIDTCHSESHIHMFRRADEGENRRVLVRLTSIEDVERAYDEACGRLLDEWEQERERWSI